MDRIYLDWNATTPLRPETKRAMAATLEIAGNPSSIHAEGRAARKIVEDTRQQLAQTIGVKPADIVFTSGGTEANASALQPLLRRERASLPLERLVVSAIEHPSVLAGGRFAESQVELAPVTVDGVIDLDALRGLLIGKPPALVSVMLANNETGVIQPISEVAALVHEAGGVLHVDCVQAFGKIPVDARTLGADLVSVSAHKLGGPKGVGALIIANPALQGLSPLLRGGGQERNHLGGTENVIGLAGFGAAVAAARDNLAGEFDRLSALQAKLETALTARNDVVIFGKDAMRLPNTTMFAVPGTSAETSVIALDLAGVAISAGSACSSGKVHISHVLRAMAVPSEIAQGAVRLSLGYGTGETDIDRYLEAWTKLPGVLSRP
jgi:cysteine desulfurase